MRGRALLIVNAKSRSGAAAIETALQGLERIGIDAVYRNCENAGGLSRLIEEEAKGVDLVAIAGGDGTLNALQKAWWPRNSL